MQSSGTPWPGTGAPFAVTVRERQSALVMHASGELDTLTAPRMRAIVQGILTRPPETLVVDLTGVTFLGSAGMHLLLEIQDLAGDATSVRFVAQARRAIKPLRVTRIIDALDLYPTLAQALRTT